MNGETINIDAQFLNVSASSSRHYDCFYYCNSCERGIQWEVDGESAAKYTDDNDNCPTNSKFIVTPLTYAITNNNIIIHSDKNSMSELLNVVYCTIGVHQLYLSSTSSFWMLFSGTPSSSSTAS